MDGAAKREFGRLSSRELAEKGLLKSALCSALYSNQQSEIDEVLEIFRGRSGMQSVTVDRLKRTLGVFNVPSNTIKVKVL